MDADLQDSPDEIPGLYHMVKEEGYDLVSGWKQKRYDPVLSKNLPSKLFNATARKLSGIDNLHDFNCGLKAYRSEVVKSIEIYNDMHRYIPYMAKVAGFSRIGEKVVQHQARKYGTSSSASTACQRLPRPYHAVVHLDLRPQAHALLRARREPDVHHWLPRAGRRPVQ